ncbi:Type I restriction enzyme R protein N terminus (HSDR_N) [Haloarcula vallismortis]|uniref:Uncharacterized protein n=2 Tax=Haloarcula vallismortis TaxID=28442 RepID=M0JTB3_HALVA|nr:type I restriction endonuclease [Haloarcula vallismortis]EMA11598.1 hypothetical protein C437_01760 [Haloarcula vallismortis ATCC 29715]SDW45891.1 Type I restriction enzyme R protein N terminus (HSDR_N) [Haloarcula vallismortis]
MTPESITIKTNRLSENPEENNGILRNREFEKEEDLKKHLAKWLKDRRLQRAGAKAETDETEDWDKKEIAAITEVETEFDTGNGFGDIAIHHDGLNLSYNHVLANPLIIELKNKQPFKEAVSQAVRYKQDSQKKYREEDGLKYLQTAVATSQSLSTGEIASRPDTDSILPVNSEAKRIFWKLGIGVMQSTQTFNIVLSFNEQDKVVIK